MKKILFLLLSTIAMHGQVPADATQLENIQITNNVQDLTADKVNVQSANGVLNWQLISDFQNNKPYFSTGLLKNGLLTINADNTKFNLSAGIGVYSDFSDPENVTSKVFNFPAFNAVSSPYLATSNITYVAVNYNGGSPVLVMQASKFSNTQLRDLVVVGAVVHSNFTTINTINNISSPSNDVGNSVADLFNFLGAKNQEGNVYSANGANLQLNKSAGVMFKYGANFHVDLKNPHNVFLPEQLSLTFRYRLRGGFEGTDRINIDTDNYDLNNVLTTVPPAKPFQIQTIFIPQTGQTRLQYGQDTYSTLADAISAINTRKFVTETNLASQFVKVAYLVVKKGATSLNVAADADIRQATQFDGTASGGVALTYQSIIDALGYTPEDVSNKTSGFTLSSTTTYPNTQALVDGLATRLFNTNAGTVGAILRYTGTTSVQPSRLNETMSKLSLYGISGGFTTGDAPYMSFGGDDYFGLIKHPFGERMDYSSYHGFNFLTSRSGVSPVNAMTINEAGYVSIDRLAGSGDRVISASPSGELTISSAPTAPTAAPGTNTTQIATTAFVQATARPYKVYTALLSQSGTNAPVVIGLDNSLGANVSWARIGTGTYSATISAGNFTGNRTYLNFQITTSAVSDPRIIAPSISGTSNSFIFYTYGASSLSDGVLNTTPVEIRIYP